MCMLVIVLGVVKSYSGPDRRQPTSDCTAVGEAVGPSPLYNSDQLRLVEIPTVFCHYGVHEVM